MALGISVGYSSIAGLICTIALLFPGLIYRMKLEERILISYFGDSYRDYSNKTCRMFPEIW
jgi:protein-S-isoprenylcysteine O-methyltransferase Ste14